MRLLKGGVGHLVQMIKRDLSDRETSLTKPQRSGLADIASSIDRVDVNCDDGFLPLITAQKGDIEF